MTEFSFWELARATALLLLVGIAAVGIVAFICVAAGLPYVP